MMNTPPELEGLTQEALRFWRLIDERTDNEDGTADITLACGHLQTWIVAPEKTRQYAFCSECADKWMEAVKAALIHD